MGGYRYRLPEPNRRAPATDRKCEVCGERYNVDQFGRGTQADVCSMCARRQHRTDKGWLK
jgi:formylmethanofuran dehydrogenase subunit E